VGQGAGRFPTANSAVSDLVRCAAGSCRGQSGLERAGAEAVVFDPDYEAAFFMRVTFKNQCGIVKDLGAACEKNGVSIFRSTAPPRLLHSILIHPCPSSRKASPPLELFYCFF
jgi:hypothetical protein